MCGTLCGTFLNIFVIFRRGEQRIIESKPFLPVTSFKSLPFSRTTVPKRVYFKREKKNEKAKPTVRYIFYIIIASAI